eukprot:7387769-Prymnesium_polylepis.1
MAEKTEAATCTQAWWRCQGLCAQPEPKHSSVDVEYAKITEHRSYAVEHRSYDVNTQTTGGKVQEAAKQAHERVKSAGQAATAARRNYWTQVERTVCPTSCSAWMQASCIARLFRANRLHFEPDFLDGGCAHDSRHSFHAADESGHGEGWPVRLDSRLFPYAVGICLKVVRGESAPFEECIDSAWADVGAPRPSRWWQHIKHHMEAFSVMEFMPVLLVNFLAGTCHVLAGVFFFSASRNLEWEPGIAIGEYCLVIGSLAFVSTAFLQMHQLIRGGLHNSSEDLEPHAKVSFSRHHDVPRIHEGQPLLATPEVQKGFLRFGPSKASASPHEHPYKVHFKAEIEHREIKIETVRVKLQTHEEANNDFRIRQ